MTKEQLQEQLFNYLTLLIDKGEVIAEEIPKVLEELLMFKTFFYSANFILFMGLGFLSIKALIYFKEKREKSNDTQDIESYYIASFFSLGVLLAATIGMLENIYYLVMVTLTPRYYLLNHIIDLTTGK